MSSEKSDSSNPGEGQLFYGLPARAYLSPVGRAEEALPELRRALGEGALDPKDASRIVTDVEGAASNAAILEIMDREWRRGPTCPVACGHVAVGEAERSSQSG